MHLLDVHQILTNDNPSLEPDPDAVYILILVDVLVWLCVFASSRLCVNYFFVRQFSRKGAEPQRKNRKVRHCFDSHWLASNVITVIGGVLSCVARLCAINSISFIHT